MKFKLFGRLRDDDEEGTAPETSGQSMGLNTGGNTGGGRDPVGGGGNLDMDMGGGLDRTINNMFSQGYSEQEIKEELAGQYSEQQIEKAINNAVAVSAQGEGKDMEGSQRPQQNSGPSPMTRYQGENEALSPVDEGFENQGEQNNPMEEPNEPGMNMEEGPAAGGGPPPQQQGQPQSNPGQQMDGSNPEIEELIETIVAENIGNVEREFENVYSEIDQLQDMLGQLEERVEELEIRDDEDQQEFVQKVDEMEDHFDQYQSRIGGLEKAFQQVLPSLVENVRDLTELVQEIKQERGIQTDKDVSQQDIEGVDMEDW